jgi:steroid delta-isomerase-like uncharacterized protein
MNTADVIERYYSSFNTGDRPAFFALLNENVEHGLNQAKPEIGIPAFRDFLARMDGYYAEQVEELEIFISEDDPTRAAAEFYIRGTYLATEPGLPPATGQTYRLRVGAFFDVQEGKVSRITNYYNLQEWLRQISSVKSA